MGSVANKTVIALVHSHVNSSFVRRQLLKLDNLYHIKVAIWKQRKIYRPRKSNLLHPMSFLTHTFLLGKRKEGTVSNNFNWLLYSCVS